MFNTTAKLLAVTVACSLLNVFPASAQQLGPSRIRGTIENVDGNNLTVTARDGSTQKIAIANDIDWSRQDHARRREARLLHRRNRNAPGRRQPEGDRNPHFS